MRVRQFFHGDIAKVRINLMFKRTDLALITQRLHLGLQENVYPLIRKLTEGLILRSDLHSVQ